MSFNNSINNLINIQRYTIKNCFPYSYKRYYLVNTIISNAWLSKARLHTLRSLKTRIVPIFKLESQCQYISRISLTLSENAAQGTLKDKNKKTYRVRYFYQRYLWLYISTLKILQTFFEIIKVLKAKTTNIKTKILI